MTSTAEQSPHLVELQSLRGIAAVTVMVHHALRTLSANGWAWSLSEVPLNARGAVVLFFVLSGYVLGQSLMRRGLTLDGLLVFYVRRAFRIYPALWLGLLLGALHLWLIRPLPAPNLADWAARHYNPALLGPGKVLGSIAGANNYLLPTSWTITVELGASALLPLIVLVLLRRPAVALPMIVGLLALGIGFGLALRQIPFYIGAFAIGAGLASLPTMKRLRPVPLVTMLAAVVLALSQLLVPASLPWVAMLVETIASTILIAGIAAHRVIWMQAASLVAIGDWSYSIYLLHLPVCYTLVRLADSAGLVGADRNWWAIVIALATAIVTIPLAALAYRWIEIPGIAMGAELLRRLRDRSSVAGHSHSTNA